jgi:predicted aspartyl protease
MFYIGLTSVEMAVSSENGTSLDVEFLVDSGAKYSVLPRKVWRKLRLSGQRTMVFILADGSMVRRQISECLFRYADVSVHSPVVLGHAKDFALLGVATLENVGLVLNPFERTLKPARMMLA